MNLEKSLCVHMTAKVSPSQGARTAESSQELQLAIADSPAIRRREMLSSKLEEFNQKIDSD